jgi:hypothetical protein
MPTSDEVINFCKKFKYMSRDAVSYLLLIGKLQTLASSYYNGSIILWDTVLGKDTKIYKHEEVIL